MTDILASFPTELGWGALLVLLARAFVMSLPRIVDSVSRALDERATAKRLAEQTKLTEAQTEQADDAERRDLTGRVRTLEDQAREREAERKREKAEDRKHCDEQLAAMRTEMDERIAAIESGHSGARNA